MVKILDQAGGEGQTCRRGRHLLGDPQQQRVFVQSLKRILEIKIRLTHSPALPARHERGERRREEQLDKVASSPRPNGFPSPPQDRCPTRAMRSAQSGPPSFVRRRGRKFLAVCSFASLLFISKLTAAESNATNEYTAVDAIFTEHCLDCHGAKDPGRQVRPGKLRKLDERRRDWSGRGARPEQREFARANDRGKISKGWQDKIMPPGKREKLEPAEIAVIKAWIDAGAHNSPAGARWLTRN